MTAPTHSMELTITRPDDWHLHVRDGASLASVVAPTARCFRRAIIMPNLVPPVTTTKQAVAYRRRILAATPAESGFEPLMTLYLTDDSRPQEIQRAVESGVVHGVKLYPAGATTNSASGVTDVSRVEPTLRAMAELGLPLLVHGEVTHREVDIFDREREFLDRVLVPMLNRIPELPVVLEHVTTAEGVAFVKSATGRVGATITPQHLLYNRNAIFQGALRPHYYCLPVLKRERHREALVEAATGGDGRFFLGTDSAPHPRHAKENACGCAGVYSAPLAMPLYAEAFEAAGALDRLEGFASIHGPEFYGMERNRETVTLTREPWTVPSSYPFGGDTVVPIRAEETVTWRLSTMYGDPGARS